MALYEIQFESGQSHRKAARANVALYAAVV
jgi:hypothetical protein